MCAALSSTPREGPRAVEEAARSGAQDADELQGRSIFRLHGSHRSSRGTSMMSDEQKKSCAAAVDRALLEMDRKRRAAVLMDAWDEAGWLLHGPGQPTQD